MPRVQSWGSQVHILGEAEATASSAMETAELPEPLMDCKRAGKDDADFFMFTFKVQLCSKQFSHDWSACPYAHPKERARRRDPRRVHYTSHPCPECMQGQTCPRGAACPYAHSVYEYWLHPTRYRTQICKNGANCRRTLCFFAHSTAELRFPEVTAEDQLEEAQAAAAAAATAAAPMQQQQPVPGYGDHRAMQVGGQVGAPQLVQQAALWQQHEQVQAQAKMHYHYEQQQQHGASATVAALAASAASALQQLQATTAALQQLLPVSGAPGMLPMQQQQLQAPRPVVSAAGSMLPMQTPMSRTLALMARAGSGEQLPLEQQLACVAGYNQLLAPTSWSSGTPSDHMTPQNSNGSLPVLHPSLPPIGTHAPCGSSGTSSPSPASCTDSPLLAGSVGFAPSLPCGLSFQAFQGHAYAAAPDAAALTAGLSTGAANNQPALLAFM